MFKEWTPLLGFIGGLMAIGIVYVYFLSAFWYYRYYTLAKNIIGKHNHSLSILVFSIVSTICMAVIFVYLFLNIVFFKIVELSYFGAMIIRPAIFLVGCTNAVGAKIMCLSIGCKKSSLEIIVEGGIQRLWKNKHKN